MKIALLVALACFVSCVGFEYLTLPNPADLATHTPAQSALMQTRLEQAREAGTQLKLRHSFVPLSHISPHLQRAVILSEDARFWSHHGIDWEETEDAIQASWKEHHLTRGASTITQQLAKNMYLSEQRSITRKLKEWVIAHRLEEKLTKKRILELYLNFAEWGNGVFGIEAAARIYFGKSAASLDSAEAAVLTAMLPAPRKRNISHPSRRFVRRAHEIAQLLIESGGADPGILARVDSILGVATQADDEDE